MNITPQQLRTQELLQQLESLASEGRNPDTMQLDQLSTADLLAVINKEDQKVAFCVAQALPEITQAVDMAVQSIQQGGRVVYMGAGTSGRLGVLDAVECRPTFSVSDNLVIGLIAGGERAIIHAVEGAEDNKNAGQTDLEAINANAKDIVIGIAASGRTPYVIGGLEYANALGCNTVSVVCNPNSEMLSITKVSICAHVGPECLTGSTRMKSGTAQKLVLNMLSTAVMVKLGKVYENLMVDVNASNQKLHARAVRIVMQATQCKQEIATAALDSSGNSAKLAILMLLTNRDANAARSILDDSHGHLRQALNGLK